MKLLLSLAIVFFSLLGIVDASYLTWQKLLGSVPPCSTSFNCETVLSSSWSMIGPIPLSVLGIGFYTTFLLLGSLLTLGNTEIKIRNVRLELSILVGIWGTLGILFSLFLIMIMGLVLKSWCLYCLLSASNCLLLLGLSYLVYRTRDKS